MLRAQPPSLPLPSSDLLLSSVSPPSFFTFQLCSAPIELSHPSVLDSEAVGTPISVHHLLPIPSAPFITSLLASSNFALHSSEHPQPSFFSPAYQTGTGMWSWPQAAPTSSTRVQTGGAMWDLRGGFQGRGGRQSEEPRPL